MIDTASWPIPPAAPVELTIDTLKEYNLKCAEYEELLKSMKLGKYADDRPKEQQ